MNFLLDKTQWKSIGKDVILFAVGGAITIIYQQLTGATLGETAPLVMGGFAILANYLHRVYGVSIPAAIDTTPDDTKDKI